MEAGSESLGPQDEWLEVRSSKEDPPVSYDEMTPSL